MQDEEMDIKIREAASQHHPSYSDKSWKKMEKLLDIHLPQEKNRKRWFIFLLLFLLAGTALTVSVLKPWSSSRDKNTVSSKKDTPPGAVKQSVPYSNQPDPVQPPATIPVDAVPVASNTGDPGNNKAPDEGSTKAPVFTAPANQPVSNNTGLNMSNRSANKKDMTETLFRSGKRVSTQKSRTRTQVLQPGLAESNENKETTITTDQPFNNIKDLAKKAVTNEEKKLIDDKTIAIANDPEQKPLVKNDLAKKTDEKKEEKPLNMKNDENKTKPEKKKRGFGNNFAITASVGADMSFIKLNKPGKITLLYGAGLSYGITKHFSVSAGFYVSDKIYSATPEQYNNTIYPYLTGVNGDCRVYQIPVSIGYRFGQRKKHNWSGSAGLTSLLMKKEKYEYEYKNPAGQYYNYNRTIDNQNKHYFSVLSLAAGYQYHLGNRVTLSGEPFVNIPLKGIGFGKMKLNSAGVQVTVSVKPFAKKNK